MNDRPDARPRDIDVTFWTPLVRSTVTLALGVFVVLGILDLRLAAVRHYTSTRRVHDESNVPSASALRLLALGHREWAADLVWSAALLYFGESLATHSQQRFLQRYADTLEGIDPNFRRGYVWGATISVYNTRVIRRGSVENANRHLERGLRRFPDDGEMTYQLGFNYYFELPRLMDTAEERTACRRRGAEYLRRAAALGYGPPWMALAAAEALRDTGLREEALEQLRELLVRTEEPAVRARIAERITELTGQSAAEDPFMDAVRQFQRERLASFPYVSPLLYLFVGPGVRGLVPLSPAGPEPAARHTP